MENTHIIKTFIFLIFYASTYGQVDSSKVKIIHRTYHECVPIKNEWQSENAEDNNNIMQAYSDDISVSYPYITTTNKKLDKFINDTIQKIAGVYKKK